MDYLIGRSLGPYLLHAKLGSGGMGTVYRATHQMLDQPRAVKVLPQHLAQDVTFVQRFLREARTAATLRHPNIIQIYDVGEHDGHYYIAMELIQGIPLADLLKSYLPADRTVGILGQLAEALDYAHQRGMTHRDVKPANVLVGFDDHVTLIDFGIARAAGGTTLTRTGAVIGTPQYLAPEAITSVSRGPSVDLYALGIVAYEWVVGRTPFSGLDTHGILYAQVNTAPPRPSSIRHGVSSKLERVIERQLAKDPARRYPTARAFVDALIESRRRGQPTSPTPQRTADRHASRGVEHRPSTHRRHIYGDQVARVLLLGLVGLSIVGIVVAIGGGFFPPTTYTGSLRDPPSAKSQLIPTTTGSPERYVRLTNTQGLEVFLREEPGPQGRIIMPALADGASLRLVGPERTIQAETWLMCVHEGRIGWLPAVHLQPIDITSTPERP